MRKFLLALPLLEGVPPQNEYDVSKGYTYQYFKGVPLHPFGHGLSYTRFRFTDLRLSRVRHRRGRVIGQHPVARAADGHEVSWIMHRDSARPWAGMRARQMIDVLDSRRVGVSQLRPARP